MVEAVQTVEPSTLTEPFTLEEAMNGPEKVKWLQAIREEIMELERLGTFEFSTHSDMEKAQGDQEILGGRWVFKIKADANVYT